MCVTCVGHVCQMCVTCVGMCVTCVGHVCQMCVTCVSHVCHMCGACVGRVSENMRVTLFWLSGLSVSFSLLAVYWLFGDKMCVAIEEVAVSCS